MENTSVSVCVCVVGLFLFPEFKHTQVSHTTYPSNEEI